MKKDLDKVIPIIVEFMSNFGQENMGESTEATSAEVLGLNFSWHWLTLPRPGCAGRVMTNLLAANIQKG